MAAQKISLKSRAEDTTDKAVSKFTGYRVEATAMEEVDDFNLRDYDDPEVIEQIEGFAYSYENKIYVPPLLVWTNPETGVPSPIEGHLRRRGALLAISRGVNVLPLECVHFTGTEAQRVSVMLRSAEGLALKPLKIAIGYLRLHNLGDTNADIAKKHKRTPQHVEQMLLLAKADSVVHELVRSGKVDAQAAIEVIRAHKEKAGDVLLGKSAELAELGKERVTRGTLKEWAPAPKIVHHVIGSMQTVVEHLDSKTRRMLAKFEKMEPEQIKAELHGQKIEIDAASFVELLKANGAVAEAKSAKELREAEAKAKASQKGLDLGGGVDAAAPDADAAGVAPFVGDGADDPLYQQTVKFVTAQKVASVGLVQRQMRVGHNRAMKLFAAMQEGGVVAEGTDASGEYTVLKHKA